MISEKLKRIFRDYLNSVKLSAILVGTYQGSGVQVNERFTIPNDQLSGNLKMKVKSGDKVRLLAGTGWDEFYILEIIGQQEAFKDEIKEEALK